MTFDITRRATLLGTTHKPNEKALINFLSSTCFSLFLFLFPVVVYSRQTAFEENFHPPIDYSQAVQTEAVVVPAVHPRIGQFQKTFGFRCHHHTR
jgi:hypothetical protein